MKWNVSSSEPELNVVEDESSRSLRAAVTAKAEPGDPLSSSVSASSSSYVRTHTDLQDSSMTSPTDTGSISEDESLGGWLGGITADFRTLAFTLKETAGGVANFVKSSAMAVASEIAHLEAEEELAHRQQQQQQQKQQQLERYGHCYDDDDEHNETLHLPWEVPTCSDHDGDHYEEDEVLKKRIQALSTKEETFLRPFSAKDDGDDGASSSNNNNNHTSHISEEESAMVRPPFVLDEPRIQLVSRILQLDDKLAAMHARLSGRSDIKEAVFWQNYFFNCEMAREEYFVLLDPPTMVAKMESFNDDDDDDNGDRHSYVEIPSPPASQRSVGSMVVIHPELLDLP